MVEFSESCVPHDIVSSNLTCSPPMYSSGQVETSAVTTRHHHDQRHQHSMGPPSDSASSLDGGVCCGCGETISDRFYLYALDSQWHNACLRCCVCSRELEGEGSCYVKNGFIYCKEDYFRRYGVQKCARCQGQIQSGELVMRAQNHVYHIKCFCCAVCSTALQTGDHFGVVEDKIYCRTHFEHLHFNELMCSANISSILNTSNHLLHEDAYSIDNTNHYTTTLEQPEFASDEGTAKTATSQVKSRQRKRRQAENVDQWSSIGVTLVDPETGYAAQSASVTPVKQKRMRTSFKHHQLRIMKQYFGLNHNPDAKDLKQLSQKTGLSKRVLQVWFQNARAKFRRGLTSKDGSTLTEGSNSPGNDAGEDHNSMADSMSDCEHNDMQDMESNTSSRSMHEDNQQVSSPSAGHDSVTLNISTTLTSRDALTATLGNL